MGLVNQIFKDDVKVKSPFSCFRLLQVLFLGFALLTLLNFVNIGIPKAANPFGNMEGRSLPKGNTKTFHERHCSWFSSQLQSFKDKKDFKTLLPGSQTYTLVVSTFFRDEELVKNVDHWLSCPNVNQVQIVWHDPHREPPELLQQMEEEYDCTDEIPENLRDLENHFNFRRLDVRRQTENLLTNRFRVPEGGFNTNAVFNIDDDAVIDCRLMSAAFEQWKKLGDSALVGFEPRQINWLGGDDQGYTWYASCEQTSCEYNTLWPTKGAFLHKSIYDQYFEEEYSSARDLVDTYLTGEDILMTYVHFSSHLKKDSQPPPILAIQATHDFKRQYYSFSSRFSYFRKFQLIPEFISDLLYIDEINSLGLRSSWSRGHITSAIGELAEGLRRELSETQKSFAVVPPMVNSWFFLSSNLEGKTEQNVCNNEELFEALRCTTYASLQPLSTRDAKIFSIPLWIGVFGGIAACWTRHKRRQELHFNEVRQRKVSGADISEFYSPS